MKEEKFTAFCHRPLWDAEDTRSSRRALTHKMQFNPTAQHSARWYKQTFVFFLFFVVFLSNHLKMTFANFNMKVEKLTNLLLRTVAKQCASEPEDEVQVFPEITQDSSPLPSWDCSGFLLKTHNNNLSSQDHNRSFSFFFFLTSKHYSLKKGQSHKCFTWSLSH